jgi:DNA end-binding protein Ku
MCPIHGEVPADQIISGHEYAKGQYVTIDPEELDKLRTPADKMVSIDAFVSPDAIDPLYLSGQAYYLVPEGKVGEHPFTLIREGMLTENRYAVAKVVMHTREHVVLLRPIGLLLAMHVLDYDFQVKKPAEFEDMVPKADLDPDEIEMAKTLIASKSARFDPLQYKDHSTEKLKATAPAS